MVLLQLLTKQCPVLLNVRLVQSAGLGSRSRLKSRLYYKVEKLLLVAGPACGAVVGSGLGWWMRDRWLKVAEEEAFFESLERFFKAYPLMVVLSCSCLIFSAGFLSQFAYRNPVTKRLQFLRPQVRTKSVKMISPILWKGASLLDKGHPSNAPLYSMLGKVLNSNPELNDLIKTTELPVLLFTGRRSALHVIYGHYYPPQWLILKRADFAKADNDHKMAFLLCRELARSALSHNCENAFWTTKSLYLQLNLAPFIWMTLPWYYAPLAQLGVECAFVVLFKQHSRNLVKEANWQAIKYMEKAGFDSRAVASRNKH